MQDLTKLIKSTLNVIALAFLTNASGQNIDITTICKGDIWPQNYAGFTGRTKIGINDTVQVIGTNMQNGILRYEIIYKGVNCYVIKNDIERLVLLDDTNANNLWRYFNLKYEVYGNISTSGQQYDLRAELEGECLEFERNLEAEGFIFQDAYLENYLQSILNGLHSKEFIVGKRQGELNVKVLKDNSLNAFILPNGTMYINVGLLAVLQNEDELKAVMLHELAHFILDHYIVNLGKLKKEEARLAFWSSVATATAAATEVYLAAKHDVFFGGNLAYLTAISSVLYSDAVMSRLGIQFSLEQEQQADECASKLLVCYGINQRALQSAFNRIKGYYSEIGDYASIDGSSTHPSLQSRINRFDESDSILSNDIRYQVRVSLANSYAAALDYYDNHFTTCLARLKVNINNNTAEESDYVLAAMALSKVPSIDADSVALKYLSTAEDLNVNPVISLSKQKALVLLRLKRNEEAVLELKKYISLLHEDENPQEIAWAKNILFKAQLL